MTDSVSLSRYGLDNPRAEISLLLDDSIQKKLQIGKENPTASFVFTRFSDSARVFLVPKSIYTYANKDLFALRDKSILKFDREKVDKVEITKGKKAIVLEKSDGEWRITEPVILKALKSNVSGFLGRMMSGKIKSVVSETLVDLSRYGFDRPRFRIDLYLGETSGKASLIVGDSTQVDNKPAFYAKDESRNIVFTLDQSTTKFLNKSIFDLQDKRLVYADISSVNKVETSFENSANNYLAEFNDSVWVMTSRDSSEMEKKEIESVIRAVLNARPKKAVDYSPEDLSVFGFAQPTFSIKLFNKAGELGGLIIGRKTGEDYYIRSIDAEHVYLINESSVKRMMKEPDLLIKSEEEKETT
jgi:hypothetical protein